MNSSTGLEVIEESNYYPFGLKHQGYNALAGNPAYQYQYNGKELQKESEMYDYRARFYMPDLGKWGVVDPLAEKDRRWTPYRYAYNNPVIFIDPDGRNEDWYENIETNNKEWFDGNKEIEGYKHLGNSVQDGNLNYASDGKVYDDSPEGKGQEINPETNIKEISITKEKSFDLMRWISGLRNNKETFYSFSGGANDPDAETLKKLRPRDHIEANDMFYMIFMFYGRNTRLSGGTTGFQEALVQFGLDAQGIGNPVKGLSGPEPAKSDTFGIWDRQATGILRSNDGSPFGVEYKNVRGEGLSKRTLDSLNKAIKDSNNYWNKQLIK